MTFKKNVGKLDAVLRIGVGATLLYVGFFNADLIDDSFASAILGIFGSIILLTGVVRNCPMYDLIGFNSCGVK